MSTHGIRKRGEKKGSVFRPPTRDELQNAKETENLFGSNLLKLQISELLAEVSPGSSYPAELDQFLRVLKDILNTLPRTEILKLSSAPSLLPEGVKYPLPFLPTADIKGQFGFFPPKVVKVVGNFLLRTQLKDSSDVDLDVLMPEECLQPKDILNYRYFHKRAVYLGVIAGHLKQTDLFKSVSFSTFNGNPLLPVIVLSPKDHSLANFSVVLSVSLPEGYFPFHRLYPDKNNVRIAIEGEAPPTPTYNAILLTEIGAKKRHLEDIFAAIDDCPAIRDAVLLYKVWSRQRCFEKRYGCFGGFHFSMLMVYLLNKSKISAHMSSYQLFLIGMKFIAETDLSQHGISIIDRTRYPTLPSMEIFHFHYDVVFLDSAGILNLCAGMTSEQYSYLRHEASLSLQQSSFESLYLKPIPMLLEFDGLVRLELPAEPCIRNSILFAGNEWVVAECDNRAFPCVFIVRTLTKVLKKGLHGRVKLIVQEGYPNLQWEIHSSPQCVSCVTFGVLFEPASVFDTMTVGPSADSPEAKEFRSFWGGVSELRRFPDGTIKEAVVWNGENALQRRTILEQILKHLLQRHANISSELVTTNMDNKLESQLIVKSGSHIKDTGEESTDSVIKSFTELSGMLRSLKGLPLAISTVQGSSPVLSHCHIFQYGSCWVGSVQNGGKQFSLFPISSHFSYPLSGCFEVIIQLESSGKWPNDVTAIRSMETLFYLAIHRDLSKQYKLVSVPTDRFIDISKDGYIFRVFIYHQLLHQLLQKSKSIEVAKYEFTHIHRPSLTSFLSGIQGVSPSFGLGARLCKRWIAAHLLSPHITEETVELLVAHLFLNPEPFEIPNSPVVVLYRYLSLLMSHDWSHDPLIININNTLSNIQLSEMKEKFSKLRSDYPEMCVMTQYDTTSSWTKDRPSYPVLRRIILLARESLSFISKNIFDKSVNLKQVFRSPLADYDVLIHLNTRSRTHTKSVKRPRAPSCNGSEVLPVPDFNPVDTYLSVLQDNFSEYALFFHDKYGGSVIGVLWKPDTSQLQPFKIQSGFSLVKTKSSYIVNKESLLGDMKILGEGLIERIEKKQS